MDIIFGKYSTGISRLFQNMIRFLLEWQRCYSGWIHRWRNVRLFVGLNRKPIQSLEWARFLFGGCILCSCRGERKSGNTIGERGNKRLFGKRKKCARNRFSFFPYALKMTLFDFMYFCANSLSSDIICHAEHDRCTVEAITAHGKSNKEHLSMEMNNVIISVKPG